MMNKTFLLAPAALLLGIATILPRNPHRALMVLDAVPSALRQLPQHDAGRKGRLRPA